MKQALCMTDLNDFNRLSDGEIKTIEFIFVDRVICEIPANGFFQLVPYVSFNYLDKDSGKLNFAVYRRPSKGEGEARLQGNSSFGFGGHIDAESDLVFTEKVTLDDGTFGYRMTLEDIKNTCMTCAKRELVEEVGFDPFEVLEIPSDNIMFGLEREQEPDEVGQVHVCLSIKVNLNEPRFAAFFENAKVEESEIEELRTVSVDVGRLLGSFNVENAMGHLGTQLEEELQMEKWSTLVVTSMLAQLVEFVQKGWNFKTVMDGIFADMQAAQEAADAAPQDVDPIGEDVPCTAALEAPVQQPA